jgi:hypothetical protein
VSLTVERATAADEAAAWAIVAEYNRRTAARASPAR